MSKGNEQKVMVFSREAGGKVEGGAIQTATAPDASVAPVGTKLYNLGTFKTCPYFNVHAGGMEFARQSEHVSFNEDTRSTVRSARAGTYAFLTDADVAKVKAAVAKKVVRFLNADKTRGLILTKDSPRYRAMPNDEPLGRHVYMREAPLSDLRPSAPEEINFSPLEG